MSKEANKTVDSNQDLIMCEPTPKSGKKRSWEESFSVLKAYKSVHSHCIVNRSYKDLSLAYWVERQRQNQRKGKLIQSRVEKLSKIGFQWSGSCQHKKTVEKSINPENERISEESLVALALYKKKHGDCNVPYNYREDPKLAHWVMKIRRKDKTKMPQKQKEFLSDLGFNWETYEQRKEREWNGRYMLLKEYKRCNGHFRIPRTEELGYWIEIQKALGRKGCMIPERRKKLENIGFSW